MYDLIGLEPDDLYDDEDILAVAGEDDLDDYDDLDAIAGMDGLDDLDEEDLDAIAGAFELVGLDDLDGLDEEDLDAIAGLEDDDYDDDEFAVAGEDYALPGSVEELLDAGATAGRRVRRRLSRHAGRRRGRGRVRRRPRSRAAVLRAIRARRARARARRTTTRARRAVRTMSRRVQRERAKARQAVRVARSVAARTAPRPARTIPSVTGGQTQVVPTQPQKSGPQVVPFTATGPIAPGETRVLTARPQVVFRPNQFQVAGRIAEYFRINAIRIGNQNQFAASGSVPAEAFSGNHPMPIGNTTAHPGHDIAIEVTNISASPQDFSAAMSGPALQ